MTGSFVEPPDTKVEPYAAMVEGIIRTMLYSSCDDVAGTDPGLTGDANSAKGCQRNL